VEDWVMHRVDVEDAKTSLDQLLAEALRGEEVVLSRNDQPVARLVGLAEVQPRPRFGSARGLVRIADDFEAPLADFDEYTR
jgi:antitoxin (DNA-binding transcriptional repressor) of toxin-antitoxin stability system